jgi:quinol monooxygenase YgiN
MIALVASLKVDPSNSEAFEAVIAELTRATLANEPGVKLYQLCRSQKDAGTYRLLELYESQEALDQHMQAEWFKSAGPKLTGLFAERPVLEQLDTVG